MTDNKLDFNYILEKYGDKPALIWPKGKLTYSQYIQYISHISENLMENGVEPGSRVAVLSDIDYHFPILFFAVLNAGSIIVPINPKLPKKKINELLNEVECDWLIPIGSTFTVARESEIRVLNDVISFEMSSEIKTPEKITSISFTQDATIIFTSGSVGKPKGVLHTIGNHYYSALGSNENIPLNANDCWMVSLPFFHIAGIAILFRTLISGAACFIPDGNQPLQDQLKQTNVTHLSLVSTQLYRWMEEINISESVTLLKAILLGGSQIPSTLIEGAIKQKLPVYVSYGSTEMSSQITTTTIEDLKLNPESSGKLLSFRELKIDNTGEVLVRGKTLCEGYVSGKNVLQCTDRKGWFHTGDLGSLDDNQNLIIKGRRDNMFISGGENIYPEEIEQHLQFQNHIMDVCVVDVQDDEFGARPVAFVKVDESYEIDETQIKKYLKDKLARFKIPIRILPWPVDVDELKPVREYFRILARE